MSGNKLGNKALIVADVPKTIFFGHVVPKLTRTSFSHVRYGDWSIPRFCMRFVGSVSGITDLIPILGDSFVAPRTIPELSGYNGDPAKGATAGHVLLLNSYRSWYTFMYDLDKQRMQFQFSYLSYCWTAGQLIPQNTEITINSRKCPLVGLTVDVFWPLYGTWHTATVRRWSKKKKTWVLRYREWKHSVYEDVPVQEWHPFSESF